MKTLRDRMAEGKTLNGQFAMLHEFLVCGYNDAAPDVRLIVEAFCREMSARLETREGKNNG